MDSIGHNFHFSLGRHWPPLGRPSSGKSLPWGGLFNKRILVSGGAANEVGGWKKGLCRTNRDREDVLSRGGLL